MANSNALIVEVVGDTRQLSKSLYQATAKLKSFARGTSTISSGHVFDDWNADFKRGQQTLDGLNERLDSSKVSASATETSLAALGARAGVAGFAIYQLAGGFRDLEARMLKSEGRVREFGRLLEGLTGGHPGEVASSLDNIFGNRFQKDIDFALKGLFGIDRAAKRARDSFEKMWEAAHPPASLNVEILQAVGPLDQPAFGLTPLDNLIGRQPKKQGQGTGVTATQRNQWFDAGIARQIDRVQDLKTVKEQVAALNQIEAQIQKRIDVTKDITRKLNLEDDLARVERQKQGVIAGGASAAKAAAEAARSAAEAAAAERKRRAEQAAALKAAQQQARQSLALGDFTPTTQNLRKQLASLTDRIADSGIVLSSKLKQNLSGARKVLAGEFGKATEQSRENIAQLFDTIRGEFDKQGKKGVTGGALTKTTSLNADRILDGLGLGRDAERQLKARLSHFNSAGKALAGATTAASGAAGVNVIVRLDGRPIEAVVTTRQQQRTRRNPGKRTG